MSSKQSKQLVTIFFFNLMRRIFDPTEEVTKYMRKLTALDIFIVSNSCAIFVTTHR